MRCSCCPMPRLPPPAHLPQERLRGTVQIEHTIAKLGAERLWQLLHSEEYIHCLGCLTGAQGVQAVQAGEWRRARGGGCRHLICVPPPSILPRLQAVPVARSSPHPHATLPLLL